MFAQSNQHPQSGFIALISAIIISVALLIFVAAVGFEGYFSRFSVLESDFKERSNYLAEACAQTAYIKLAQDFEYVPDPAPEVVLVGSDTCTIESVTSITPEVKRVEVKGVYERAHTNLEIKVYSDTPGETLLIAWEEVATFGP